MVCAACCASCCRRLDLNDNSKVAHDPDRNGSSCALSADDYVASDSCELRCLPVPTESQPCRGKRLHRSLCTRSSAFLCLSRDGAYCSRFSSLCHDDVPAWRLVSSHIQYVDALAIWANGRGSRGLRPLYRLLFFLRVLGVYCEFCVFFYF